MVQRGCLGSALGDVAGKIYIGNVEPQDGEGNLVVVRCRLHYLSPALWLRMQSQQSHIYPVMFSCLFSFVLIIFIFYPSLHLPIHHKALYIASDIRIKICVVRTRRSVRAKGRVPETQSPAERSAVTIYSSGRLKLTFIDQRDNQKQIIEP